MARGPLEHLLPKVNAESQCCNCSALLYSADVLTFEFTGKDAKLSEVKKLLDGGANLKRVADEAFGLFLRHEKGLKQYKRMITPPRDFKSIVFLFVGPAGSGKTRLMLQWAKAIGTYYVAPAAKGSGCYYDDYDGQDVLILDEFDGASMKPTFFNVVCDRYECVLPIHGGAGHQLVSKFIFIGSNYLPKYWWRGRKASQLKQTTRRIDYTLAVWPDEVSLMTAHCSAAAPAAAAPVKRLAPIFSHPPVSQQAPVAVTAPAVAGSMISYQEFLINQNILI